MESLGEVLRRERLKRGLELGQLANQTCIGRRFLEAMESNHFEQLPGGLFARSFLRQYARVLELDENQLVTSLRQEFQPAELPLPVPAPRSPYLSASLLPVAGYLLATIVGCGAVYSLWQNVWKIDPRKAVQIGDLSNIQNAAGIGARPEPSVQPATHPADIPSSNSAKRGAPPPNTAPDPGSPIRVMFAAKEPAWISIDSDGHHVYTGVLQEQQSKEWSATVKMTALIGNAGGLDISLNGKQIGPLGKAGEVRMLVLTSQGATIVPRVRNFGPTETKQPEPRPE